ncbi:MAG: peptidoglycan DD-metalloendopeptidase family protein [Flavobacterium sp.]|nr:peptidoglycan DD-metalloendopeptidase family protein [Flavobacterium sp.]
MKQIILILILISIFSCKKKQEDIWVEDAEIERPIVDFGFKFDDYNYIQDTTRFGDTFKSLLQKQNLNGRTVDSIVKMVKKDFNVNSINRRKACTYLREKGNTNKLQVFIYQIDRLNYYLFDFRDTIAVYKRARPLTFKNRTVAGTIIGNLVKSLQNVDIDKVLARKLTKTYAWSIDFFKIKKGDKFCLSFTERYINDTVYDGIDSLRCAFVEYKGKKVYAFPYIQDQNKNKVDYYDEQGNALRNFFLKSPLKFGNLTSHFSTNRFHPVQLIWKAHKGTDYAAPTGTPIMTTATGIVEQTGFTAGNGNFVKVKHDKTYATQYLHMSKILVKRGQSVKQGDIIGRVGSTGLATGPHVCYRFWKNSQQVDALKLKLPNSEPMAMKSKPRFFAYIKPLKEELDSVANSKFK